MNCYSFYSLFIRFFFYIFFIFFWNFQCKQLQKYLDKKYFFRDNKNWKKKKECLEKTLEISEGRQEDMTTDRNQTWDNGSGLII